MSNVNNDYSIRRLEDYQKEQNNRNTGELGKNEFLQLLVAQLANQDPLEPAKDTEFIAQLAQFNTLDMMQQLTKSYANTQASSLVGKYVEGVIEEAVSDGNGGYNTVRKEAAGQVIGVTYHNGEAKLAIKGYANAYMRVGDVKEVVDAESIDGMNFNQSVLDSSNLIGKYVEATYKVYPQDENKNPIMDQGKDVTTKGIVDRISVEKGQIMAHIGDNKFDVRAITVIQTKAPEKTDETDKTEEKKDEPETKTNNITPSNSLLTTTPNTNTTANDNNGTTAPNTFAASMMQGSNHADNNLLGGASLRTGVAVNPYGMNLITTTSSNRSTSLYTADEWMQLFEQYPNLLTDGEYTVEGEPNEDGSWG